MRNPSTLLSAEDRAFNEAVISGDPTLRDARERRFRWGRLRFEWGRWCYLRHPYRSAEVVWWEWED